MRTLSRAWELGIRAAVLVALAPLAACIPTPPGGLARDPHVELPSSFGGEDATSASASGGGEAGSDGESQDASHVAAPAETVRANWHAFFADPHLVALIDEALTNNQELNIAVQEMIVSNSDVMARRGDIFPSLSAGVNAGLDRTGRYTSQGRSDESTGVPADLQNYSVGLFASWEVDIWGRLRDSADAAMYRYFASAEGRNFIVTRLVAEIANRYYELMALDRQLQILTTNIQLQEDSLAMVRLQQQAARVTMAAVTRFEAQLRGFQARQFDVRQRIVATENELNFLLGRFPRHIERSTDDFLALEPPMVQTGVPSRLLENRPDVRQAELALRAARLDVSAARARFYPSLRLDAGIGYRSFDITQLFATPESIFYGLLAGVTAPLLNRSGITAEYYAANSSQAEAVLRYERTILTAFIDVSTGLSLLRNVAQAYELKEEQVARLHESIEISTQLFENARADYLEVLTARREALDAEMELVELKQRQLTAAVALYQALGGGWVGADGPPSDPEPMGAVP